MKTPVIPQDQREILDAGWFGITLLVSLPIHSFYRAEKQNAHFCHLSILKMKNIKLKCSPLTFIFEKDCKKSEYKCSTDRSIEPSPVVSHSEVCCCYFYAK